LRGRADPAQERDAANLEQVGISKAGEADVPTIEHRSLAAHRIDEPEPIRGVHKSTLKVGHRFIDETQFAVAMAAKQGNRPIE
jgi:hypothetical protein